MSAVGKVLVIIVVGFFISMLTIEVKKTNNGPFHIIKGYFEPKERTIWSDMLLLK